jgi:hypothetical protein
MSMKKLKDYPHVVNITDKAEFYAQDGKYIPRIWLHERGYTVVDYYRIQILKPDYKTIVLRFFFKEITVAIEFALRFL